MSPTARVRDGEGEGAAIPRLSLFPPPTIFSPLSLNEEPVHKVVTTDGV